MSFNQNFKRATLVTSYDNIWAYDLHFIINLTVSLLISFNSLLASGDFLRLLITCANSLDPDQDRLSFDTLIVFLKEFFEKVNSETSPQHTTTKA